MQTVHPSPFTAAGVSSSLEFKLFRMTTLVGLLTTGLIVFYDVFVTGDQKALTIEAFTLLVFGLIHWQGRNTEKMPLLKPIFLSVLWLILNAAFLFTGGLGDGFTNLIMLSATVTLILTDRPFWKFIIPVLVLNVTAMILLEHIFPSIRRFHPAEEQFTVLITTDIFLSVTLIIGLLIVGFMKIQYDRMRQLTIEQNNRLLQINEELAIKNEALSRKNHAFVELNTSLERKVAERTAEISAYQQRLMEIAFFNSHRMRGPLANILGILEVLPETPPIDKEEDWPKLLKLEAKKLDEQIQEVQEVLNAKPKVA